MATETLPPLQIGGSVDLNFRPLWLWLPLYFMLDSQYLYFCVKNTFRAYAAVILKITAPPCMANATLLWLFGVLLRGELYSAYCIWCRCRICLYLSIYHGKWFNSCSSYCISKFLEEKVGITLRGNYKYSHDSMTWVFTYVLRVQQ